MKTIQDEIEFFEKILTLLERHFNDNCEIVLHDLLKPYEHTIVDIRNGDVTGRKIGGCGSNLGLEVLKGSVKNGDIYNYITYTDNNKVLRSSTIYIRDDDENVIGSICINTDISESLAFEKYLKNFNKYSVEINNIDNNESSPQVKEFFVDNIQDLLIQLFAQAENSVGVPAALMNRNEKLDFLKYLDEKGAFLITKSGEKVCEFLSISKYTLYKYLDETRTPVSDVNE